MPTPVRTVPTLRPYFFLSIDSFTDEEDYHIVLARKLQRAHRPWARRIRFVFNVEACKPVERRGGSGARGQTERQGYSSYCTGNLGGKTGDGQGYPKQRPLVRARRLRCEPPLLPSSGSRLRQLPTRGAVPLAHP